jgi:hypothetical protein
MMALKRWDLLPATEEKFGQETATIHLIGQAFDNATVYVCECMDANFDETIQLVVATSRLASNPQVGDGYEGCNHNTKKNIGTFTVLNIVTIKSGKVTRKANERFLHDDAPVLIFA